MRGLELPINMIVVIAIAVLALTVIAAFFTGSIGKGINTFEVEQAWGKACNLAKSVYSCDGTTDFNIAGYKITGDSITSGGTTDQGVPFSTVCRLKGQDATVLKKCYDFCGCPA